MRLAISGTVPVTIYNLVHLSRCLVGKYKMPHRYSVCPQLSESVGHTERYRVKDNASVLPLSEYRERHVFSIGELQLSLRFNKSAKDDIEKKWGIQFGDEAGGGVSRPTPYVETAYASFVYADGTPVFRIETVVMLWMPEREEV